MVTIQGKSLDRVKRREGGGSAEEGTPAQMTVAPQSRPDPLEDHMALCSPDPITGSSASERGGV
jgi:hypothetical protein